MTIFDFLRESGKSGNRKLQIYMDGLRVNQSVDYFRDGMRRPVSAGCDTLPIINALEAQGKGDRL